MNEIDFEEIYKHVGIEYIRGENESSIQTYKKNVRWIIRTSSKYVNEKFEMAEEDLPKVLKHLTRMSESASEELVRDVIEKVSIIYQYYLSTDKYEIKKILSETLKGSIRTSWLKMLLINEVLIEDLYKKQG